MKPSIYMYMYFTYCTSNATVQHHTSLQILVINNKVTCQGNWLTTINDLIVMVMIVLLVIIQAEIIRYVNYRTCVLSNVG